MPPYKYITVANEGPLTIVTINRPDARNALNADSHRELTHAFDAFGADPGQFVAIVTGAGDKAFCAGHDLKQDPEGEGGYRPPKGFGGLAERFDLDKPLIAAVNGGAFGGGFEIALSCDIIVASDHARFALSEPRVGLAALGSGIFRLPRQIGLKRAMDMMLTARAVSAAEGLEFGFVNQVVSGSPMPAAREWAARILECSPMSIRATKGAATRLANAPLDVAMREQWNDPAVRAMLASEDTREGPLAFAEKRAPVWKGR